MTTSISIRFIALLIPNSKIKLMIYGFLFSFLLIIHLFLSIKTHNFSWLGAFGGVTVIIALIIGSIHSLLPDLQKDVKLPATKTSYGKWVLDLDNGAMPDIIEEDEALLQNKAHLKMINEKYNFSAIAYFLTILGTVTASYSWILTKNT